jgi:hypothetical protein
MSSRPSPWQPTLVSRTCKKLDLHTFDQTADQPAKRGFDGINLNSSGGEFVYSFPLRLLVQLGPCSLLIGDHVGHPLSKQGKGNVMGTLTMSALDYCYSPPQSGSIVDAKEKRKSCDQSIGVKTQ